MTDADAADAVAAVAGAVPGVTALHAGVFGEVATHLPGRKVSGVRMAADVTEVHVSVLMGADVLDVARRVRAAVEPLVLTPVHVYIEDVTATSAPPPLLRRTP
ncbi:MAG: hypothetical protein ABI776_14985 [Nocardioidaceae bacterium]